MRTLDSMSKVHNLEFIRDYLHIFSHSSPSWFIFYKSELDDLYLKYTEKNVQKIKKKLKDSKSDRDKFIRKFIRPKKTD